MIHEQFEVAIIGGSNAGLAAALTLGRSGRKTIVFDTGSPRNKPAAHAHNFFTRDGSSPEHLLQIAKEQLIPYLTIEIKSLKVTEVTKGADCFMISTADGSTYFAQKVILATGVTDVLMDIKGMRELWGKKIFNCPYCHGWEIRDRSVAIIVPGAIIYELAVIISHWNKDIVFLVNGSAVPPDKEAIITARGWQIVHTPISELIEEGDGLRIIFADGEEMTQAAAYSKPSAVQFNTELATQLGCQLHESGCIQVDGGFQTTIPGVFAAGDITHPGFHQVSAAAAGGHMAAAMCNNQLCKEDFQLRLTAVL